MSQGTVGISITAPDAETSLSRIIKAEEIGIGAAWLTSGGGGGEALTLLAGAAARTERILLGSSIVQTWSRHPVTVAQQVQVIASLAPGRLRLGVGPGHKQGMESTFGADFQAPLGHLGEYLKILKALLQRGSVDFDGKHYSAHARIPGPVDVPVMASALRPRSFDLCGAESDGAISWVCPHVYVRDVSLPALKAGAEHAGRPTPPLIVHAPVSVDEDQDAVRTAVRERIGYFPRTAFYARMFEAAGYPGGEETGWTDEMLDAVVISGDEVSVTAQLDRIFEWGASEVLATVVPAGDDAEESEDRTLRLLARASA